MNLSPGLDFETRIVAKVSAAERLREALASRAYEPAALVIGTATDAYQPIERQLGLTRASRCWWRRGIRSPSSPSPPASSATWTCYLHAAQGLCSVYVSVTSLDSRLSRILEPRAAAPEQRLQTIRRLSEVGVPVGVSVSPVIPFLNEPGSGASSEAVCRSRRQQRLQHPAAPALGGEPALSGLAPTPLPRTAPSA